MEPVGAPADLIHTGTDMYPGSGPSKFDADVLFEWSPKHKKVSSCKYTLARIRKTIYWDDLENRVFISHSKFNDSWAYAERNV